MEKPDYQEKLFRGIEADNNDGEKVERSEGLGGDHLHHHLVSILDCLAGLSHTTLKYGDSSYSLITLDHLS